MILRFLIGACLPAALARAMDAAGYPAVHVFDLGMARDDDIDIWRLAATRGEVVVSKDADFAHVRGRKAEESSRRLAAHGEYSEEGAHRADIGGHAQGRGSSRGRRESG